MQVKNIYSLRGLRCEEFHIFNKPQNIVYFPDVPRSGRVPLPKNCFLEFVNPENVLRFFFPANTKG